MKSMKPSAIFSKNVLEKPHLVYTCDVRYFVCIVIRLDRLATQLRFLSGSWYWFYESRPFSRLYSHALTPSFPLQLSVAMVGSRNVSCPASKFKKWNWTLNIEGKGEEKETTMKNQFSKNLCRRLSESQNEKWKRILLLLLVSSLENSAWESEIWWNKIWWKKVWMIKHLSQNGLSSIVLQRLFWKTIALF